MRADESVAVLVARFLRSNNYTETLDAFLEEAGLPPDAGGSHRGALTIEQILQEKRTFDLTLSFEKTGVDDEEKAWTVPSPSAPSIVGWGDGDHNEPSNVLHASVEVFGPLLDDHDDPDCYIPRIIASGANKMVHHFQTHYPYLIGVSKEDWSDSPILSCQMLFGRYVLTSSMSGKVTLLTANQFSILDQRRDHAKYVVEVVCKEDESGAWVATAAWDAKVLLYRVERPGGGKPSLGAPVAEVTLPTSPDSILFVEHPEIDGPVLVVSRKDSTFLYYYALPDVSPRAEEGSRRELMLLGRQNLAPHSNAWIAFTPSALAISPHDPALLAVATSAVPHMKLIVVRLLLPPPPTNSVPVTAPEYLTQASQARGELAQQDREDAAILIHCNTLAPQTPYSTPALAWRPDGSGIFVNGDDGVVRGIEVSTGKVVATLKGGHEPGSKVRCLWAGWGDVARSREVVVSGGFDRRLIVWEVEGVVTEGHVRNLSHMSETRSSGHTHLDHRTQ